MGLGITVGETDEELSAAVATEGVTWTEPVGVPIPETRESAGSFPYSFLHTLRRVYALLDAGEPVTPLAGRRMTDADDQLVADAGLMFDSHLLCHSDCEGYYIPVAFDEPLFVSEEIGISGGGMVGSSQGLLAELRRIAPAIGVRLEADGSLSDAEAARLAGLPEDADFERESVVWLTLHEACLASIASGYAIVFC